MFITGVLIVYHAREIPATPAETPCFPVPFYAFPPTFLPVTRRLIKKRACFGVKQTLGCYLLGYMAANLLLGVTALYFVK